MACDRFTITDLGTSGRQKKGGREGGKEGKEVERDRKRQRVE